MGTLSGTAVFGPQVTAVLEQRPVRPVWAQSLLGLDRPCLLDRKCSLSHLATPQVGLPLRTPGFCLLSSCFFSLAARDPWCPLLRKKEAVSRARSHPAADLAHKLRG